MFASDLKHENAALAEKLLRLYSLKKGSKIELSFRKPYLDLLQAFNNPHRHLPPVIHVAGTNGKGSIIAMLRAILQAAGYRVHAYTSPHLIRFNERIVLAGQTISDAALESLIDEALAHNKGNDITFFEITTAMAFAAFVRAPADIVLMETGMGGRLDCTNVIEKPLVAIISTIGYDHVEYLGDTLGKIAGEKAGIIKTGGPGIVSRQADDSVFPVFETTCAERGSPLFRAGAEWFSEAKGNKFRFVFNCGGESVDRLYPLPNLNGLHQIDNAGAALAALQVIKDQLPVSNDAIATGLQNIVWAGRMQNITPHFSNLLPRGWEVWIDGAHNQDGARALSTQAAQWQQQDGKALHLVLGMMAHKNPKEFVQPLLQHATSVTVVDIPGEPAAHNAQNLIVLLKDDCNAIHQTKDFLESIKSITQSGKVPGRILITGSLYLAGHVLNYCDSQLPFHSA